MVRFVARQQYISQVLLGSKTVGHCLVSFYVIDRPPNHENNEPYIKNNIKIGIFLGWIYVMAKI